MSPRRRRSAGSAARFEDGPPFCAFCFVCLLLLAGCASGPIVLENHTPRPVVGHAQRVEIDTVIHKHNAAVAGLDKLWARTRMRLRWREVQPGEDPLTAKGPVKRASAEGTMIVQRDWSGRGLHGTAVTAGKLGITGFWAGSDGQRAWLFDLRDRGTLWVGDSATGFQSADESLPIPPQALPWLLDLVPLDLALMPQPPQRTEGGYIEVFPAVGVRMLLDPRDGRAVRVFLSELAGGPADDTGGDSGGASGDFSGGGGGEVLAVHLDRYQPMSVEGIHKRDRPTVPTRLEIYLLTRPARLSVRLEGMTDQRIRPAVFDLDVLINMHKPARIIP